MGTVEYENVIELLLEEKDKNENEIVDDILNRFGFPDKDYLFQIRCQLLIKEKYGHIKFKDGKYHLLKLNNSSVTGRWPFLIFLRETDSRGYLEKKPWIRKLKEALEERMLK